MAAYIPEMTKERQEFLGITQENYKKLSSVVQMMNSFLKNPYAQRRVRAGEQSYEAEQGAENEIEIEE